jgi:hypothetical protein
MTMNSIGYARHTLSPKLLYPSLQVSVCTDERFLLPTTPPGCEGSCVSATAITSCLRTDGDSSYSSGSAFSDSLERYR